MAGLDDLLSKVPVGLLKLPETTARHVNIKITIADKNVTKDLTPYNLSLDYTDNAHGQADDLTISFSDEPKIWLTDWFPERHMEINAEIIPVGWENLTAEVVLHDERPSTKKTITIKTGSMLIDEIDYRGGGGASVIEIRSSSMPPIVAPEYERIKDENLKKKLKTSKAKKSKNLWTLPANPTGQNVWKYSKTKSPKGRKTRTWQRISVKALVKEIAKGSGLDYEVIIPQDFKFERLDQSDESDIEFLKKICDEEGLALKLYDKKIVVYDKYTFERQAPIMTIKNPEVTKITATDLVNEFLGKDEKPEAFVKSFSFKTTAFELYDAAKLQYHDSKKNQDIEYVYKLDGFEGVKVFTVNRKAESLAHAQRLAKAALARANEQQDTGTLELLGDTRLTAGVTIDLDGFGYFDGRWFIDVARHSVSSGGYNTTLDLRRIVIPADEIKITKTMINGQYSYDYKVVKK